jgi:hypothetical protein
MIPNACRLSSFPLDCSHIKRFGLAARHAFGNIPAQRVKLGGAFAVRHLPLSRVYALLGAKLQKNFQQFAAFNYQPLGRSGVEICAAVQIGKLASKPAGCPVKCCHRFVSVNIDDAFHLPASVVDSTISNPSMTQL